MSDNKKIITSRRNFLKDSGRVLGAQAERIPWKADTLAPPVPSSPDLFQGGRAPLERMTIAMLPRIETPKTVLILLLGLFALTDQIAAHGAVIPSPPPTSNFTVPTIPLKSPNSRSPGSSGEPFTSAL